MKSIALIHTVRSVANTFEQLLKENLTEDVKIHNLWDDFLANQPNEVGEFTIENRNRLFLDVKAAEQTGADMILATCSTLTPVINMIRPFCKVPLIAIDDAMGKRAVTFGEKVLILATADSTIAPTVEKLTSEAREAGVPLHLQTLVCPEAFHAMKALDMERHDVLLKELAKTIRGYDCIVLAQASMAHLETVISDICGCPVISSPKLCICQVEELLKTLD